jgi:hypothetical protein
LIRASIIREGVTPFLGALFFMTIAPTVPVDPSRTQANQLRMAATTMAMSMNIDG